MKCRCVFLCGIYNMGAVVSRRRGRPTRPPRPPRIATTTEPTPLIASPLELFEQRMKAMGNPTKACQVSDAETFASFINAACAAMPDASECDVLSMWMLYIFSCYKKLSYVPRLKMDTANAAMTFLKCTSLSNKEQLMVAKFQLVSESDDIIVDNVVGYALALLPISKKMRRHLMTYVDSCLAPVVMKKSSSGERRSYFDIGGAGKSGGQCAKLNLTMSVRDPKALNDVLRELNTKEEAKLLMNKVSDVLGVLFHLGKHFGFVHNDLHLGNILHDGVDDALVVIDYGRALFDKEKLPEGILSEIENWIGFEELKAGAGFDQGSCTATTDWTDYNEFCRDKNVYMTHDLMMYAYKHGHQLVADTIFMFDQMTVAMNVVKMLHGRRLLQAFEFSKCFGYDDNGRMRTVGPCEKIAAFVRIVKEAHCKRIVAGVFWFSMFIEYLYMYLGVEERAINANGALKYDITLVDEYIFRSMQLIDVPDFPSFCAHVEKKHACVKDVIDALGKLEPKIKNNTKVNSGGGSRSRKLVGGVTIEHLPANEFASYFKAYNNAEKAMNARARAKKLA